MFFTDEQAISIQHQIEAGFIIEAVKLVKQYGCPVIFVEGKKSVNIEHGKDNVIYGITKTTHLRDRGSGSIRKSDRDKVSCWH